MGIHVLQHFFIFFLLAKACFTTLNCLNVSFLTLWIQIWMNVWETRPEGSPLKNMAGFMPVEPPPSTLLTCNIAQHILMTLKLIHRPVQHLVPTRTLFSRDLLSKLKLSQPARTHVINMAIFPFPFPIHRLVCYHMPSTIFHYPEELLKKENCSF